MSLATFAAVVSALELAISLPLILAPRRASEWMMRFVKDEVAYRVTGALLIVLSVSVLFNAAAVTTLLPQVMCVLALITGLKGLAICWWPGHHARIVERMLVGEMVPRLIGLLALTVGVLLGLAAVNLR